MHTCSYMSQLFSAIFEYDTMTVQGLKGKGYNTGHVTYKFWLRSGYALNRIKNKPVSRQNTISG